MPERNQWRERTVERCRGRSWRFTQEVPERSGMHDAPANPRWHDHQSKRAGDAVSAAADNRRHEARPCRLRVDASRTACLFDRSAARPAGSDTGRDRGAHVARRPPEIATELYDGNARAQEQRKHLATNDDEAEEVGSWSIASAPVRWLVSVAPADSVPDQPDRHDRGLQP